LGYGGPYPKSSKYAYDLIAKRILPSENSKNILEKLNYSGELPKNEFDADVLIKSIRKPTENQLKKIIEMGGKGNPHSWKEAKDLIDSLSPVTPDQIFHLDKYNIRNIPRNKKEASDIIDKDQNGTLIQPDPCPKCEGSKKFDYGTKTDECPYCDGSGNKKEYDEDKGDQKILDDANQEYAREKDSDEEDMNDSGVESKTTDTPQDQGYGGWDLDKFR